jgi:hypothetical protein
VLDKVFWCREGGSISNRVLIPRKLLIFIEAQISGKAENAPITHVLHTCGPAIASPLDSGSHPRPDETLPLGFRDQELLI